MDVKGRRKEMNVLKGVKGLKEEGMCCHNSYD